jgi:hypothetical protein
MHRRHTTSGSGIVAASYCGLIVKSMMSVPFRSGRTWSMVPPCRNLKYYDVTFSGIVKRYLGTDFLSLFLARSLCLGSIDRCLYHWREQRWVLPVATPEPEIEFIHEFFHPSVLHFCILDSPLFASVASFSRCVVFHEYSTTVYS